MLKIAILGCGTVASGVIKLLRENAESIAKQAGEEIEIKKVLARTQEKAVALGLPDSVICDSFEGIPEDPEIGAVVELMGGTDYACECIKRALKAGKHVVTANKDLIAEHLEELLLLAEENNVSFSFEASVCGGIPLIGPLLHTLSGGGVRSIRGILNGTTNYILTRMSADGMSYEEALALARENGFAEADPSSDVEGHDAARKAAILASLCFHAPVNFENVVHEGVTLVTKTDVRFAASTGYTIKLLGMASSDGDAVEAGVSPVLVPLSHPLASVSGANNAVFLEGNAVGSVMLYGPGAGSLPTAASVVGDIMEICRRGPGARTAKKESVLYKSLPVRSALEGTNVYYVRLIVEDKPRVLSGVASVFGDHGVSVASLVQEQRDDGTAELMFFTHPAPGTAMNDALSSLRKKPYVRSANRMICMEN